MTATKPKPRPRKPPVLLVTGGDTGIGLGIARKFAEAGYRVAIGGLDRRRGHRVVAALRSVGRRAHPEQCRREPKEQKVGAG